MKLMLLMTIKTARLHRRGRTKNDSWRVPVGFPTPSDHKGVGKSTADAQLRLWGASGGCTCLNRCDYGGGDFSR